MIQNSGDDEMQNSGGDETRSTPVSDAPVDLLRAGAGRRGALEGQPPLLDEPRIIGGRL